MTFIIAMASSTVVYLVGYLATSFFLARVMQPRIAASISQQDEVAGWVTAIGVLSMIWPLTAVICIAQAIRQHRKAAMAVPEIEGELPEKQKFVDALVASFIVAGGDKERALRLFTKTDAGKQLTALGLEILYNENGGLSVRATSVSEHAKPEDATLQ
jgi:hypothetical protein